MLVRSMRLAPLVVAALVACSPPPSLTVYSNPPGATVIDTVSGTQFIAPATLTYNWAELRKHRDADSGCLKVAALAAGWPSEATLNPALPSIALCGDYTSWHIVLDRPSDFPGHDIDIAHGERHMARLRESELRQIEAQIRYQDAMASIMAHGLTGLAQGYAAGNQRRPSTIYVESGRPSPSAAMGPNMTCTPQIGPTAPWSNSPTYNCQ